MESLPGTSAAPMEIVHPSTPPIPTPSPAKSRLKRSRPGIERDPRPPVKKMATLVKGQKRPVAQRQSLRLRLKKTQQIQSPPDGSIEKRITAEMLTQYRDSFETDLSARLAQLALQRHSAKSLVMRQMREVDLPHTFSHEIDVKPVATDQESSSRCWIFATLNTLRIPMIREYELDDDFELSQNFVFFYDKLEQTNRYLNFIIDNLSKPLTDPTLHHKVMEPVAQGGCFRMVCNILKKHGIVPKSAMPETYQSKNPDILLEVINRKLKKATLEIRKLARRKASPEELDTYKQETLSTIYNLLSRALGAPPETISWSYEKEDGSSESVKDITPLEFFYRYAPYKVDDRILVINKPVPEVPFHKVYIPTYAGNTYEGDLDTYLNLRMTEVIPALIRSIKAGEAVYFSADVTKHHDVGEGVMDIDLVEYETLFGTSLDMPKSDRVATGDAWQNHAMVITAVHIEEGKPVRWKIENSWGDDRGKDGYITVSHDWLMKFAFGFAIDKKFFSPSIVKLSEQDPIQVDHTSPLGSRSV